MPATVTQVVKQFQQDWTHQLEPEAIRRACHDIAYQWRQHVLDPVVTMQLFFLQILHANTAYTHLRHLTRWTVDDLTVRELRYQIQHKGFRVKTITLVTTLVHAELYGVEALSELYFARWGIETNLAHVKTTMGLDVLKCKTVDGVLKELIVFALTYNLVRLVMGHATRRQHVDIDRISFIDAARWLAAARDDASLPTLVVNPHRPYRYEPRVRKRRPKQYPLMKSARQSFVNHWLQKEKRTNLMPFEHSLFFRVILKGMGNPTIKRASMNF
jgi:hypothetical protein